MAILDTFTGVFNNRWPSTTNEDIVEQVIVKDDFPKPTESKRSYICVDTNIPLLDSKHLIALGLGGDIVCIAETVIDELDNKKSGMSELAFQARSFGRMISNAIPMGRQVEDNLVITKFKVDGAEIWIVSVKQYPDLSDVAPNILNDRKIIEVALQLQKFDYNPVKFISNDVMCRIRAESFGLDAQDFKVVDKVDYEFTKELEVEDDVFRALHGKNIYDIDPDHLIEHYNYKFTTPASSQMKIASINNDTINILGKDTEAELRRQDVSPRGADQLLLARAIQDPTMDLIVCEALAGSGKTLCSLSNAIRLIKTKSPYTSILYIRASINDVEDIEEVGFLPGTAEEKNAVYFHPLYDSLDHIARQKFVANKNLKGAELETKVEEQIEKIIADCNIMPLTGLGMRGRTFTDSVVIIDEVQGMSKSSLQKVLTRFGKNCKIILVGSNNQIDNPNMSKYTNGLSVILNDCATQLGGGINKHVIPLHRVVRSNFAEYAERLFSREA